MNETYGARRDVRRIIVLPQLVFLFLFILVLAVVPTQGFAHVEGKGTAEGGRGQESLILSKYSKANIELTPDPGSQQWKQSFEKHIESLWGHEISIRTLNNGTHVFFLLSWYDPTTQATKGRVGNAKETAAAIDGAVIIFEIPTAGQTNQEASQSQALMENKNNNSTASMAKGESKVIWYWDTGLTSKAEQGAIKISPNEAVITKARWNNEQWNLIIGREIQPKNGNESTVSFHTGVREEGFVKFVVWDGSKGESFMQVNDDEVLPHSDFILLPEINVYPKDVYVWSGVLAACAVLFLFVEERLYKNQHQQQQQKNEKEGLH